MGYTQVRCPAVHNGGQICRCWWKKPWNMRVPVTVGCLILSGMWNNLQKYQVDFGEVNIRGEQEDTVRIMSIHKSKGLEFPIVFAAGMGKRFNMSDASTGLVIHQDLGIGMQAVDPRNGRRHRHWYDR